MRGVTSVCWTTWTLNTRPNGLEAVTRRAQTMHPTLPEPRPPGSQLRWADPADLWGWPWQNMTGRQNHTSHANMLANPTPPHLKNDRIPHHRALCIGSVLYYTLTDTFWKHSEKGAFRNRFLTIIMKMFVSEICCEIFFFLSKRTPPGVRRFREFYLIGSSLFP